ncbi:DUF4148 domain-containing protein [Paraburkholderia sp. DGU8]|jgi:hypothetical protein|uniref:DUF4148 domain-containing protein n=1 Tax=Paraburkholderia sp. DGU8 TaxID=3161997 RepID=UPI003466C64B
MKAFVFAALLAGGLAAPAISFAQDAAAPLTRAEVRADLVRLEQAGYRPSANDLHYPADIQAAEARLHAPDATAPSDTGEGGVPDGSSQAGGPTTSAGTRSIYFGH